MTQFEFEKSLTDEQRSFYKAAIREAFSLEEKYYRECVELKQMNRALLSLLTLMEKKDRRDRRRREKPT